MAMREDCKHYATRTYANGEMVRMCRIDLAPEAPWRCPDNCVGYERRTWNAGWTTGNLADTAPKPVEPDGDREDIAALLDMAEDVINDIGAGVLAEHRAAEDKKKRGKR